MSVDGRIHQHTDPYTTAALQEVAVRMTSTGHLEAEDDEGNCEYKWRLTDITEDRFQHLVTQMKFRVAEGQGRCLYEIGVADDGAAVGLCDEDYYESIATVRRMADSLGFQMKIVYERVIQHDDANGAVTEPKAKGRKGRPPGARIQNSEARNATAINVNRRRCAEIHVTRKQKQVEDLRIAFCGSGGSGKSTLVGVLTQGTLDDGSGSVRSTVFNHKHEVDTGCTSSVTNHIMGFDAAGRVTNYDEERLPLTPIMSPTLSSGAAARLKESAPPLTLGSPQQGSNGCDEGISTIAYALNATRTIAERSVKLATLLDLGGQDKYSKTAYFGITSRAPGYACIVAAADRPIVPGISLHVSICLAMKVPFCIVVTKCDTVGELELDDLQFEIDDFVRKEAKHMNQEVRTTTCTSYEDALDETLIQDCVNLSTVPVFLTSCVEGLGIGLVKTFFHKLPPVIIPPSTAPAEVLVDGCFNVSTVGPVLSGFVTKGDVHEGQDLLMGPDRHGHFQQITIYGIHEKGSHVTHVSAGTDATFSVRHIPPTLDANRKGTILFGIGTVHPQVCMAFECKVRLIDAEGSVVVGQEPIVHCRNIRQAAKITFVIKGDKMPTSSVDAVDAEERRIEPKEEGLVLCRFLYHPEVLEKGSMLLMRWNRRVRLVGTVNRLVPLTPCSSPSMRPTPTDLFETPELLSLMLPEEVDALQSNTNILQQETTTSTTTSEQGNVDDELTGGDLFGSDSEERTQKRPTRKAPHVVPTSPNVDVSGDSSSEGLDALGDSVVRKFSNHPTILKSVPQSPTELRQQWAHSVLTDESSRTPEMKPFGTAEFGSPEPISM